MNKAKLVELKKARNKLDDAILGYCDGNVAQELDEAFAIIDELIKTEEQNDYFNQSSA
tara:strand:- start:17 stop:190 length:174 start_codon:yes stop_codon:yes gene_type:complete